MKDKRHAGEGSHQHIRAMITRKLNKWKNASEAFNEYTKPSYHKGCTELAENFLKDSRGEQLSVVLQINSERYRHAAENHLIHLS